MRLTHENASQALLYAPVFLLLTLADASGSVRFDFNRLAVSPTVATFLIFLSLLATTVTVPAGRMSTNRTRFERMPPAVQSVLLAHRIPFADKTALEVNVGSALLPFAFCTYLASSLPLNPVAAFVAIVASTAAADVACTPGLSLPIVAAPIAASLVASLMDPAHTAPLTYLGGTIGTLIGGDVMHLRDARNMGLTSAQIGSGKTFDGVFLTLLMTVMLI